MSCSRIVFIAVMLLIIVSKLPAATLLQVRQDDATAALIRAENAVASAYNAVLDAEHEGANVQDLAAELDDAADYLSKAQISYRLRDYPGIISFSNLCLQVSEDIRTRADELKLQAYGPRYMSIWFRITITILGIVSVSLASVTAWRIFKKRYTEHIIKTKPEVT